MHNQPPTLTWKIIVSAPGIPSILVMQAVSPTNDFTSVVGCYKNATVYRGYQSVEFIIYLTFENGLLIHNIVE